MSALGTLQTRYGPHIDREVQRWLHPPQGADPFYGMMLYQLGYVNSNFAPSSGPRGKRSRPVLCLAVCDAVGGDIRDALPLAAAIELLHNFSLIHDDIEDRDPVRHHRPTVWKVWGEAQAINAGDAMFALAARAAAAGIGEPQASLLLIRRFFEMALDVTRGQHLDMSFEDRLDVSPCDYLAMISLKTAALIAFSTWSGALAGGATDEVRRMLEEYGANLGKAFQIHDDIAGIWATSAETGKEAAKDLENRKKTLPLLLALQQANAAQSEVLHTFLQRRHDNKAAVLDVLSATGAREAAAEQERIFLQRALTALQRAGLEPATENLLADVARELTA